jgi:hypothetical protein
MKNKIKTPLEKIFKILNNYIIEYQIIIQLHKIKNHLFIMITLMIQI